MAQPRGNPASWELPQWKTVLGTISAVLLAAVFLVSGIWKITDPFGAATKMTQALVPAVLSLPVALGFGITEAFSGVLLLVPRFRRWGAVLAALMLVAFLVYFAIFYNRLVGGDCSCFPWLKRVVGPGFFISDGIMLLGAVVAGVWAPRSEGRAAALLILAAVAVFGGASYGLNAVRETGIKAPESIVVDGKPYDLTSGRVLLYFYDPMCSHCDAAARQMSTYKWNAVKIIAIPTAMPQYAAQFVADTKLPAATSLDVEKLRAVFQFGDPPFGVALERGRQKTALRQFDDAVQEPVRSLRQLGFIE
jgi:uncharacterized membrane protein YphA (DoxX/SURF4 family)